MHLQVATKALALNVIDLVKKMKLDPPKSPAYATPTASKFPPLPPLPPLPAGRSSFVSSVPSTPVSRSPPPRRPPTPVGNRAELNASPPPSLPTKSPGRQRVPDREDTGPPLSSTEAADAVSQPPRVPPGRRSHSQLNKNSVRSQRSVTSIRTNQSRMSQASAGSIESIPPPAYTVAGDAIHTALTAEPSPGQQATTPKQHQESQPSRPHNPSQENHRQGLPTSPLGRENTASVQYSVFPIQRAGPGGSGTRTTAWVSDQVDPAARSPPLQHVHRSGSRYESHDNTTTLQTAQSLQSLTIPEDKAVGVVLPKHSSIIDFSPLTPMLSQLQLSQFGATSPSSVASSPSIDTNSPGAERSRMSPLSQTTSVSSLHPNNKAETPLPTPLPPPLPIPTPSETQRSPRQTHPTLTPLSLPAAALEHPAPAIPPAIPEEWHQHERNAPTFSSDRASSAAGFSSHSFPSSQAGSSGGWPQPREPDVALGPGSSLYAMGGFCPGAQAFRASAHQEGVRRVAGHVAGVSTATARCDRCSYGHAFAELDLDVNDKSSRATFARPGGVLFRIRLLYKSHLASQRPQEAFYGCLFCAHTGNVPREGDATVFRSSDDLLRHLARHSQPLPEVPGLTVLHGKEVLATDPRVGDFDVWLTEEQQQAPSPALLLTAADVAMARLPCATASRAHVQRYAEKKLARPEGVGADALLEFFAGARVIGVAFPRALGGKWCTGWHDGTWGYFPARTVELEKPPPGRLDAPPLRFQGSSANASAVSVVARWRWDPAASIRDAADRGWVGFDKGERITNVGWPVLVGGGEGNGGGGREAWCWSGTNAKGRFGVFPRSHVDEATLRDDMAAPVTVGGGGGFRARKKKEGGGKGSTAKSLFGVRRRSSTTSSRSSGGGITEII